MTCIAITGMHRSGTSLVSSYLQRCGLSIGERFIPPGSDNPRGYFEDEDFVRLHTSILRRNKSRLITPKMLDYSEHERLEALQLIDSRREQALWGWKDPRTVLFIPLWNGIIPDIKYLFVYRHPFHVIDSLLHRRTDKEVIRNPLAAMNGWIYYNELILKWLNEDTTPSVLVQLDEVLSHPMTFVDTLNGAFCVNLRREPFADVFESELLNSADLRSNTAKVLCVLFKPRLLRVYDRLNDKALNLSGTSGYAPRHTDAVD